MVRIGGACGYWGESSIATPQFLQGADLDYIVYDYLAEITMSIMARARARDPAKGYATDFVTSVIEPNIEEIARGGVKVISNAGGVNPKACGELLRLLIAERGLSLKVAVITGDDLMGQCHDYAVAGIEDIYSGAPLPPVETIASINAYLGAFPIARALDAGADIVITGRCVDSAVTLGACIHEFGWGVDDPDLLAGGSLAGHILECGPQSTGGNFTDWKTVADTIHDIGYPIAEINPDGSFTTTKPAGTGGAVTVGTVSEQLLYEIGDPQAYILPDVVCDFSRVSVMQESENRVLVSGAKGCSAPDSYKVSLTAQDGFRGGTLMTFYGFDAEQKAISYAEAAFRRARLALKSLDVPDFTETSVEILGAESQFGDFRELDQAREVVMKVAARHPGADAISVLLRELTGLGLAGAPGLSGFAGTRARPMPVLRLFSFMVPKEDVQIEISDADGSRVFSDAPGQAFDHSLIDRPDPPAPIESGETLEVPLIRLAWGRSGDKGDKANIGIIARQADFLPYIWAALPERTVAGRFAHFLAGPVESREQGSVERFLLPESNAINFLLHGVLGGGGVSSIRNDPQGKGFAQILLATPIPVPPKLVEMIP
jgi:hypothetical protein